MKIYLKYYFKLICGIFKDRILLFSFAIKDFQRRYAGSYFGIVWGLFQPFLTILVYWAVFQFAFQGNPVNGVPFILWFSCGIIPWLFFSEAFSISSNCFLEYAYLVKKVVFNIDILPLVKILSSAFIHMFFIIILLLLCFVFGYYPTIFVLQALYYFFCTVVLLYAVTLITSSVIVFFRDLSQIISVLLLVGMWCTPIAWELSAVPSYFHVFIKWNPIYYIVEGYRDSFVNQIWFWQKPELSIRYWIVTIFFLSFGVLIYQRLKPRFADVL